MSGKYNRTEEMRAAQSARMKKINAEKTEEQKRAERTKAKQTMADRGVRAGRKKGCPGRKTGFIRACKNCGKEMYVIPSRADKKFYCSRDCMYSDHEYIEKVRKGNIGVIKPSKPRNPNLSAYKKYAYRVRQLTEKNYVEHLDVINPNRYPRTLNGVDGGYQLDHIKSIKKCFNENLPPEIPAAVENLQMIPWRENLAKRTFEPIEE